MSSTSLKKDYAERIAPALMKKFNYTSTMQVPRLLKIVINEGLGEATGDKKIIETAINELTAITGQYGGGRGGRGKGAHRNGGHVLQPSGLPEHL